MGSAATAGAPTSSLGFQSSLTDAATAKVLLRFRQYDPGTARFTNPDVFVGSGADLALGTDPLTGNRYLFAGANPVANFEDGHCFAGKDRKIRRLVDVRRIRERLFFPNSAYPGGGYYLSVTTSTPIYKTETICERGLGIIGEGLDYVTGNDISRGVVDVTYSNLFRGAEGASARFVGSNLDLIAAAAPCALAAAAVTTVVGELAAASGCISGIGSALAVRKWRAPRAVGLLLRLQRA